MTMRFYDVDLERDGALRTVRVASPTDVQASDAAATLMKSGEGIVSVREVQDDGFQTDASPPLTQAQEVADLTPGAASVGKGHDR